MYKNEGCIQRRSGILLKKGDKVAYHKHNFDHWTICGSGELVARLFNDDGTIEVEYHAKAGTMNNFGFPVVKGRLHELEALTDNVIYHCIYPHLDWNGEPVEHYDGNEAAYV